MVLRLHCPHCRTPYRLPDPPPPEGKKYRCTCGTVLTVQYPEEVREELKRRVSAAAAPPSNTQGSMSPVATAAQVPAVQATARPTFGQTVTPPRPVEGWAPPTGPAPMAPPRPWPAPGPTPPPVQAPMSPGRAPGAGLTAPQPPPPLAAARPSAIGFTAPPTAPPLSSSRAAAADLTPPPSAAPLPPSRIPVTKLTAPPIVPPLVPRRSVEGAGSGRPPPALREPISQEDAETDFVPAPEPPPPAARRKKKEGAPRRPFPWRAAFGFGASLAVLGALGVLGILWYYAQDLPSVESLRVYEPPTVTVITDAGGQTLGEFFEEQRYVTPLDEIPQHVQDAFIAAEDASFWEHGGLDYIGIARAMVKNVREARMAQGASTITQQVARSFLLSREKKLERKVKEVLLAWRVEQNFDKEYILFLYLNQIFLGHGAYGVEAAARLYFGKGVGSLTVPEAAIIAGLPQAPSTYSPNRNLQAAKARQRYVLDQMALRKMITPVEADAYYNTPLDFVRKRDHNLDLAPYYVEHIRRYLVKEYGHDKVYREGLQVRIPIDQEIQRAANQAVQDGVRRVDHRMGYQGPRAQLTDVAAVRQKLDEIDTQRTVALSPYDPAWHPGEAPVDPARLPPLSVGEETEAVIEKVAPKWALLAVGSRKAILPVEDFAWCHKVNPLQDFRYFQCKTFDDVLHEGDVVLVRVKAAEEDFATTLGADVVGGTRYPRLAMSQDPAPESAILTMRLTDGAVLAMVGGTTYEGTEFNRATQARRQVGSTFKPFVYAAGIDRKDHPYTPSSILVDAPIVEEMMPKVGKTEPELWKLDNADGEYLGDTTLRRGLILSRNAVTVRLAMGLGSKYLHDFFGRFGFDTELEQNFSTALGTSSLSITELARAYSVFATLGDRRDMVFVSEVKDRHGKVLERTEAGTLTPDVLDEDTAFVMVGLLQDVVRAGTAGAALSLAVPVAGKTGTTSEFRDAWFVGFTPEVLTTTWIGLDKFESMGRGMYGGDMALPVWIDVMREALKKYPPSEYPKPPGVVFARVDSKTGLLAKEGDKAAAVAFKRGTEPTTFAPEAGDVDTADFLSGEY